jgi:hypothetical protein
MGMQPPYANGEGFLSHQFPTTRPAREARPAPFFRLRLPSSPSSPRCRSPEEHATEIRTFLEDARIPAEVLVVDGSGTEEVLEQSRDAAVTFLPFRLRGTALELATGGPLADFAGKVGVTAMVLARQDLDLDAAPEEGLHEEIAEAFDAATEADKKAKVAEKKATKAEEEAEEATPGESAVSPEAERARRKATRARAKADAAEREAKSLAGEPLPPPTEDPEPEV